MPAFASPEWVLHLDQRLASLPTEALAGTRRLVVQQVVTSSEAGTEAAWHLTVDATGAHASAGRAEAPDLTFTQDLATAEAIRAGELAARDAFVLGKIRVGGNIHLLTQAQPALAMLAEALRTQPVDAP